MKSIKFATVLFITNLVLAACSSPTPDATQPPATDSTETAPPTSAPTTEPLTEVAAEWQGIPIMPGAISGGVVSGGDIVGEGYEFTTQATIDEISQFYEAALADFGYSLTFSGEDAGVTYLYYEDNSAQSIIVRVFSEGAINRAQIVAGQ
jgi:hypothetical protein